MTTSERLAIADRIQRLKQRLWLPEPEFDVDVPEFVEALAAIREVHEAWEALLFDVLDLGSPERPETA